MVDPKACRPPETPTRAKPSDTDPSPPESTALRVQPEPGDQQGGMIDEGGAIGPVEEVTEAAPRSDQDGGKLGEGS